MLFLVLKIVNVLLLALVVLLAAVVIVEVRGLQAARRIKDLDKVDKP